MDEPIDPDGPPSVSLLICAGCGDPVRDDQVFTLLPPWDEVQDVCRPACATTVLTRWEAYKAQHGTYPVPTP